MKKLFLSSIALFVFSISVIVFQMSCQKEVQAQSTTTNEPLNKVLLSKFRELQIGTTPPDSSGHTNPIYRYVYDFYLVNYDGTNPSLLNIPLPVGIRARNVKLSADYSKLVIEATDDDYRQGAIYVCGFNGSGLVKIADSSFTLRDAY